MPFDRNKPYNDLPPLPPKRDVETKSILKQAIRANKALAELKTRGRSLPNQDVLIKNLTLLEAKDSSEIENIFTTNDKLYKAEVLDENRLDPHTKEVLRYRKALFKGIKAVSKKPLSTNTFIEIFQTIKVSDAGIRKTPGTKISSPSGQIIYTPPDSEALLRSLLQNLENYLHSDDGVDPLIKMAIMHYQFEAIHPFTDGNGRTGRILNILYLLQQGLLEKPVLFLSSHIIANKTPYYQGLKSVTEQGKWEEWILYMLEAVEATSFQTMKKIERIEKSMETVRAQCKENFSFYSKDLIEIMFESPYFNIKSVAERLDISRQTASLYLRKLEEAGLLSSLKLGKEIFYVNQNLTRALK